MKLRKGRTVSGWPMIIEDKPRGDWLCVMSDSLPKEKADRYANMIIRAVNTERTSH